MIMANGLKELGLKVSYPGLPSHPQHALFNSMMNPGFGYGGMMILDVGTVDNANNLMRMMQAEKVGYVAVSLGYYKTLFSNSGRSTSSEVPEDVQRKMGLSEGLIRFSVGLDNDIEQSLMKVKICLTNLHII